MWMILMTLVCSELLVNIWHVLRLLTTATAERRRNTFVFG
jgi:hypothetical protein